MQLRGKTLGLIGTGAIGREVAKFGRAFGMNVIAWTFHPQGDAVEWVSLEDVCRRSDVVSLHESEPLRPGSPFYALPNVVLTPHSAGITPETTEAGLALAIDNVLAFLAGRPMNVVR